jgi:cytochrome c
LTRPAALSALLLLAAAQAAARAQDGALVFASRCAACHAVRAGAPAGPGPNLAGLLGRRLGGDAGFDYSPALGAAREAGQVWDRALLDRYLADPEETVPGNWMGANGLRAPADRAAVVEYLARLP